MFNKNLNKIMQRHLAEVNSVKNFLMHSIYSKNTIWTASEIENEVVREKEKEESLQ